MQSLQFRSIFAICLMVIVVFPGCSGAQSLAKKGEKMNAAGHYTEAADYFFQALTRNRNNIRAKMGMIDTGQKVLNDHLDAFNRTNNMGDLHEAVNKYRAAEAYELKVRRLGVSLNIPEHYSKDYQRSKEIVLEELYTQATDLMADEQYAQAEEKFKEINELDPNYRDTKGLSDVAYCQPLYIQGKVALDNGAYRMSHDYFSQILNRTDNYKDTRVLQQEAIDKGRITVALVPFENVTRMPNIEKRVSAYLLDDLSKIPDPFIRFVDRSDMDHILQEQQLSVSGIINDETATTVGELVGAQALITGKVLDYKEMRGKIQSETRKGYEGYQVKKRSPETGVEYIETRYKPVQYTEYTAANSVMITFQYKLLSLETGEILVSRIVEREAKDGVNYAAFAGNTAMLYPATGNTRNASAAAKRQIDDKLRAKRTLKSTTELSNSLFSNIAGEVAGEIGNYMAQQ